MLRLCGMRFNHSTGCSEIEIVDGIIISTFSRYTFKGTAVYAIMTTKPPKLTLQLLGPKTSATTKVTGLTMLSMLFYRLLQLRKALTERYVTLNTETYVGFICTTRCPQHECLQQALSNLQKGYRYDSLYMKCKKK